MSSTVQTRLRLEEVYDWLRAEAKARQLTVKLHPEYADIRNDRLIVLPVFLDGDYDAYDVAHHLQGLEDAWNDQEPDPGWSLLIRPASK